MKKLLRLFAIALLAAIAAVALVACGGMTPGGTSSTPGGSTGPEISAPGSDTTDPNPGPNDPTKPDDPNDPEPPSNSSDTTEPGPGGDTEWLTAQVYVDGVLLTTAEFTGGTAIADILESCTKFTWQEFTAFYAVMVDVTYVTDGDRAITHNCCIFLQDRSYKECDQTTTWTVGISVNGSAASQFYYDRPIYLYDLLLEHGDLFSLTRSADWYWMEAFNRYAFVDVNTSHEYSPADAIDGHTNIVMRPRGSCEKGHYFKYGSVCYSCGAPCTHEFENGRCTLCNATEITPYNLSVYENDVYLGDYMIHHEINLRDVINAVFKISWEDFAKVFTVTVNGEPATERTYIATSSELRINRTDYYPGADCNHEWNPEFCECIYCGKICYHTEWDGITCPVCGFVKTVEPYFVLINYNGEEIERTYRERLYLYQIVEDVTETSWDNVLASYKVLNGETPAYKYEPIFMTIEINIVNRNQQEPDGPDGPVDPDSCAHQWENGTCTLCKTDCEHRWTEEVPGFCAICKLRCEHEQLLEEGICPTCGSYVTPKPDTNAYAYVYFVTEDGYTFETVAFDNYIYLKNALELIHYDTSREWQWYSFGRRITDSYMIYYHMPCVIGIVEEALPKEPILVTVWENEGAFKTFSYDAPVTVWEIAYNYTQEYEKYDWSGIMDMTAVNGWLTLITESVEVYISPIGEDFKPKGSVHISLYTENGNDYQSYFFEEGGDTLATVAKDNLSIDLSASNYLVYADGTPIENFNMAFEVGNSYYYTLVERSLFNGPFTITYSYVDDYDCQQSGTVYCEYPLSLHRLFADHFHGIDPFARSIKINGETVNIYNNVPEYLFFEGCTVELSKSYRYSLHVYDEDFFFEYVSDKKLTIRELCDLAGILPEDYVWEVYGTEITEYDFPLDPGSFTVRLKQISVVMVIYPGDGGELYYYEQQFPNNITIAELMSHYGADDGEEGGFDPKCFTYNVSTTYLDFDVDSADYTLSYDELGSYVKITARSTSFIVHIELSYGPTYRRGYSQPVTFGSVLADFGLAYDRFVWMGIDEFGAPVELLADSVLSSYTYVTGNAVSCELTIIANGQYYYFYFTDPVTLSTAVYEVGLEVSNYRWYLGETEIFDNHVFYDAATVTAVATNLETVTVYFIVPDGGWVDGLNAEGAIVFTREAMYSSLPSAYYNQPYQYFSCWYYEYENGNRIIINSVSELFDLGQSSVTLYAQSLVDATSFYGYYFTGGMVIHFGMHEIVLYNYIEGDYYYRGEYHTVSLSGESLYVQWGEGGSCYLDLEKMYTGTEPLFATYFKHTGGHSLMTYEKYVEVYSKDHYLISLTDIWGNSVTFEEASAGGIYILILGNN